MEITSTNFTKIVPKGSIFEVIRINGFNLKLVYEYLKDKGCETFPDETQSSGKIWLYDPECQDCIEYSDEDFNEIEWEVHK